MNRCALLLVLLLSVGGVYAAQQITVPLQVVRFTPGSGSTNIANGFPLAQGVLFPGEEQYVHVFVSGSEVPLYVEVLKGRHPDGSARSILIQLTASLSSSAPLSGELRITATPRTLNQAWVAQSGSFDGAALPTSATYLTASGIMSDLVPASAIVSTPSWVPTYVSSFPTYNDAVINTISFGAIRPATGAVYSHVNTQYEYYLVTADAAQWQRAAKFGDALRAWHMTSRQAWQHNDANLMIHYWLSGDNRTLDAIRVSAEYMMGFQAGLGNLWDMNRLQDARAHAYSFDSVVTCHVLNTSCGINNYNNGLPQYGATGQPWKIDVLLPLALEAILAQQMPNGSWLRCPVEIRKTSK